MQPPAPFRTSYHLIGLFPLKQPPLAPGCPAPALECASKEKKDVLWPEGRPPSSKAEFWETRLVPRSTFLFIRSRLGLVPGEREPQVRQSCPLPYCKHEWSQEVG